MPKVSAILFDLDGVLVDVTEWHYEALNRALGLFGFHITRYEHLSAYNGLPTRKKLEMLSVEKGLALRLHAIVNKIKQVHTREVILSRCRPVFEKEYMITRLRRDGYRLAVCSNAIRDTVELMLRQSGIHHHFEFVLSNEDVVQPKPDPYVYLKAVEKLGCSVEEVVIVEDAPHGVEAARRSGAHVLEVAGFLDVDYGRVKDFILLTESKT